MKNIIGFWGYPDKEVLNSFINQYPNHEIIDLDIDFGYPDYNLLPDAYCKIIKNMINNAIHLKDKLKIIVAATGREKCDSGLFAYHLLKDKGINIINTQIETKNPLVLSELELPISTSSLPLAEKLNAITEGIYKNYELESIKSKPKFGFWGVPPNDFSILELFPNETHVYGWTRCVEANRPDDIELEMFVDENVPTVFYAQAFCAKMQLAKYLANKYNGLYIDIDDVTTKSAKAKVEAFIKLR